MPPTEHVRRASSNGGGDFRERPAHLARSIIPACIPCALVCFLIFGFNPILSQWINQLECDQLQAEDCDGEAVNKAAARTQQYNLVLEYACATLMIGTMGSLSDYIGRKPVMAIAALGQLAMIALVFLSTFVHTYMTAIVLIYIGTTINGLTGAYGTYLMGMYAYGADVTRNAPETRGRVFGKITGAVAAGNTLGPVVSGLLLRRFGFRAPLALHVGCAGLAVLLVTLVRESWDPADRPAQPLKPLTRNNTFAVLWRTLAPSTWGGMGLKAKKQQRRGSYHRAPDHDHEHHSLVLDEEATKQGDGSQEEQQVAAVVGVRETRSSSSTRKTRPPLWALALVFCLCFSDLVGQGVLFLFYAKRVYRWSPDILGYYDSSIGATKALVLLVLLPFFYRYGLKGQPPNDYLFSCAGMLCNMAYFALLALLPYPVVAFAIIPLTGLSQMTYPHLRSLFSLAVPADVQGQLFGVISALETFSTMATPYVVTEVYNASPSKFPGLIWLVLVGYLAVANMALFLGWYLSETREEEEQAEWRCPEALNSQGAETGRREAATQRLLSDDDTGIGHPASM